jgi:hypothetical protein
LKGRANVPGPSARFPFRRPNYARPGLARKQILQLRTCVSAQVSVQYGPFHATMRGETPLTGQSHAPGAFDGLSSVERAALACFGKGAPRRASFRTRRQPRSGRTLKMPSRPQPLTTWRKADTPVRPSGDNSLQSRTGVSALHHFVHSPALGLRTAFPVAKPPKTCSFDMFNRLIC